MDTSSIGVYVDHLKDMTAGQHPFNSSFMEALTTIIQAAEEYAELKDDNDPNLSILRDELSELRSKLDSAQCSLSDADDAIGEIYSAIDDIESIVDEME